MKPCLSFLLSQRVLIFIATLLILSGILSTAAVARSGTGAFSFYRPSPATTETVTHPSQSTPPQDQSQSQQTQSQPEDQQQQPAWVGLGFNIPPHNGPAAPNEPEFKYYHEAGKSQELQHYDSRFFRGEVPYAKHRFLLTHLIRAYLKTFSEELKLETWLAHGTLLGWFWNGHNLPWDVDVDVQVMGETLIQLSMHHNQSVHEYTYYISDEEESLGDVWDYPAVVYHDGREKQEEDKKEEEGKKSSRSLKRDDADKEKKKRTRYYYLDINPFATRVGRGMGQNAIDARWIDIATGMYVDITALMERDPKGKPGIISCKNFHDYKPEQLFPLRETEFEGVPALVPWDYEKILADEYGAKSMTVTEFHGHRFDSEKKEWIKIEDDKKKDSEKKPEGDKKADDKAGGKKADEKKTEDNKKPAAEGQEDKKSEPTAPATTTTSPEPTNKPESKARRRRGVPRR
ncbi:hypothetical protein VTJ04DRAFT_9419 [Mycothermus thermophilus]|uniref:uncharacterized protein n=1 Tax=Humicola insolens TaxID=85995 RepID=UPI003743DD7E